MLPHTKSRGYSRFLFEKRQHNDQNLCKMAFSMPYADFCQLNKKRFCSLEIMTFLIETFDKRQTGIDVKLT